MADKTTHIHHDLLGYIPRPHYRKEGNRIGEDGLRFTGGHDEAGVPPILAVGDSFTFGEEVEDMEAWPAHLQRLTGRRVLNGGVSGYGLDQIVLRAEQLALKYRPSIIIVGFIAADIDRTEMCRLWAHDKPWFAIENDQLVLHGVPVAERRALLPNRYQVRLESALVHLPQFMVQLLGFHARVHAHGMGKSIARLLVERLAILQAQSRARVVLLAQYASYSWIARSIAQDRQELVGSVLKCADDNGLAVVDTFRLLAVEPDPGDFYNRLHMNPRGNRLVAGLLAARLPSMALPAPTGR